jgi:predicted TIM-barrel fold metal-dependent hydrolase
MRTDVNAFLGSYPYRRVPGTSPGAVLEAMDRVGIDEAWVSHLPGIFWRDPAAGNAWLLETTRAHPRLRPVFAVHPELPGWERVLRSAVEAGAPAVRCDPTYYGIAAAGPSMRSLAAACGRAGVALMLAVRLEDGRQRHSNDHAGELPAAAARALVRGDAAVRVIITHADRPYIEEVHFGSTPEEARRTWWDISWIWGPPEDHLETLVRTMGAARFLFGTGQPLRIPENGIAKLDLLDLTAVDREAIESGNAAAAAGARARAGA